MRLFSSRSLSVTAISALVAALVPATGTTATAQPTTAADPVRELRSVYTSEYGVDRPTGVTYAPGREALLVVGPTAAGHTKLVELTPGETERGTTVVEGLDDGSTVAFDPAARRVTALDEAVELSLSARELGRHHRPAQADAPTDAGALAATYAPDGTQYLLTEGALVVTSSSGAVSRTPLHGVDTDTAAGVAYNPYDQRVYVADDTALHALGGDGRVVASHDLGDAGIDDLQAMVFAPSADPTDDPETQSLYVADAGADSTLGRIAELTTEPAVVAQANANASLVATRDLSLLSPPSPDSAGAAYMPGEDRIIVSDSEVNEIPELYADRNVFRMSRDGVVDGGGTTLTTSNEPTGVAFDPAAGTLYTSDDDKKSIFPWTLGSGGLTAAGAAFKTSVYGNTDPEGVAFDTKRDELVIVDGVGSEVFRLARGANGVFDGVAPGGDDVVTGQFDMTVHGAEDPEGVEYDAVRDTIVVVDGSTDAIYELDVNGSLLNIIDISASNAVNAAGLAMGPSTSGGGRSYYIVDRGLDNNSHPGENDGKMYEMTATLAPITNWPPSANAGIDQMIDVPETAHLEAAGVDADDPVLTYAWSMVSGPVGGTVTFGTPNQAATTANFSTAGKYVLRVAVSDGEYTDTDDVVVDVYNPGAIRTTTIPIMSGADDALETVTGGGPYVEVTSADNEMGHVGNATRDAVLTGLRFSGLPVPKGSKVESARIQFKVDEGGSEPASYVIKAEAHDNAPTYLGGRGAPISARTMGTASANWSPPAWPALVPGEGGLAGPGQLTPELASLVQEVVNRPGWAKGNAVNFTIGSATGERTGRRTAEAKDGLTPPVLVLQFRQPSPPVVDAGPDSSVAFPDEALLDGTVTDDQPATVTQQWTQVEGPGTVTFGSPTAPDTTAAFSEPGRYILRLTATDVVGSVSDDVVITVDEAPRAVGLTTNRSSLVAGTAVRLSGTLSSGPAGTAVPAAGVEVWMKAAPQHKPRRVATVTTKANGAFTFTHKPKSNSRYYAVHDSARSGESLVRVRPKLTLTLAPGNVKVGSAARVSGTLAPSAAKTPLNLQRWNGKKWVNVQRALRPARASVGYGFTVRHKGSGAFRYRVQAPAYAGRAATVTSARALRVYSAKVARVQPHGKEFVVVRNTGKVALDLKGWVLRNQRSGRQVRLPAFTVRPGKVVRIHTRAGRSDRDDLFLRRAPMWGTHGVAVLKDRRGLRMDQRRY